MAEFDFLKDVDFSGIDFEVAKKAQEAGGLTLIEYTKALEEGPEALEAFADAQKAPKVKVPVAPKAPTAASMAIESNLTDPNDVLQAKGLKQEPVLLDSDAEGTTVNATPEMMIPVPSLVTPQAAETTVAGAEAASSVTDVQDSAIEDAGNRLVEASLAETTDLPDAEAAQVTQDVLVADFEVETIDPSEIANNLAKLKDSDPFIAASMTEEMGFLLDALESGDIPAWAKPAVTQVEKTLAARGISASSVGRDALFNSIIQSAMPIAQSNASLKQDARKTTYTAQVNSILADSAAQNAAVHFNANSINQQNQFISSLRAQVETSNSQRKDAISTFNADQANQRTEVQGKLDQQVELTNVAAENRASEFNATQADSLTKFQATLENNVNQFNANQALVIAQSNVQWRRQVNTSNTAVENQVNMTNTMNAFNLNNQALSALWQRERDEASWFEQATENDKDRLNRLEATVLGNEAGAEAEKGALFANMLTALGDVMSADRDSE